MQVIIFNDGDNDDLYSLVLLIAQNYFKTIKIIGIVCDDGFLSPSENVSIVKFWINNILKVNNIDIYEGEWRKCGSSDF